MLAAAGGEGAVDQASPFPKEQLVEMENHRNSKP